MKLSVSILCYGQAAATRKCLVHLKEYTPDKTGIEFILTDNGSLDNTIDVLEKSDLPNKVILKNGVNLGFGEGHRNALKYARGEFFLCLNNDLYIQQSDWVQRLINKFTDPRVALVGLAGTPASLQADGQGCNGPTLDYVEGSFLCGRTEQFRSLGLFSPAIKRFVFEDSDISLRFRQMGYSIAHTRVRHVHDHHKTLQTLDRDDYRQTFEQNREVFLKRWSRYLAARTFSNMILVRVPSIGIGDVLCATPVISALRKDHPTARIDVETQFEDVFRNHPHVSTIAPRIRAREYDRIITLNANFSGTEPLWKLYERLSATVLDSTRPEIYLTSSETAEAEELLPYNRFLVCNFQMERTGWQGRNWNLEEARRLMGMLKKRFPETALVEVGLNVQSTGLADLDLVNRTNLRQLFAVVSRCNGFIGIDSLPLHVAQAFSKPVLAIFGAVEPMSRVIDWTQTRVVRRDDLICIGCYQKKRDQGFNKCLRGDEACLSGLKAETVFNAVTSQSPHKAQIEYLQGCTHA